MGRKKSENEPKKERFRIGTPAGESPEEGRKRHRTQCLTDVCPVGDELRAANIIEDIEEFNETDQEIATTGGVTGTKVKGGIPSGGTQTGGTITEPSRPGGYRTSRRGKG